MRIASQVLVLTMLPLLAAAGGGSSQLAGAWEGTFHGGRGDQTIAMTFRPRGDAGLTGMMYLEGAEFGPVESGHVDGDSVSFVSFNFAIVGRVSGSNLACELRVPHGQAHPFEVRRVSADTTALPPSVAHAEASATASPPLPLAPDSAYLAHTVPPGPVSSVAPCLTRGTLLLVGGGASQPELMRRFIELAGGPRANIVEIPTAAEDMSASEALRHGASLAQKFGVAHMTVLHTTSRDTADSPAFVEPLAHARAVWIEGGDAENLLHSYLGTRTERALIALLDRGGVIGGTSAGALIWGSRTMAFRAHPGMSQWRLMSPDNLVLDDRRSSAFGVLRNVLIAPHFTEFKMASCSEKIAAADPGLLQIGIDQDTALEVHGTVGTVLGLESVWIVDGRPHDGPARLLRPGARYDLVKRTVLP